MVHHRFGDVQLSQYLVISLKDFNGIPPLLLLRQVMDSRLLNVGQGVFHRASKGMHRNRLARGSGLHCGLCRFLDTGSFQRGNFIDRTAQLPGKFLDVDLIPVFLHDVHHVHGKDHGNAQLGKLGGKVEISL